MGLLRMTAWQKLVAHSTGTTAWQRINNIIDGGGGTTTVVQSPSSYSAVIGVLKAGVILSMINSSADFARLTVSSKLISIRGAYVFNR